MNRLLLSLAFLASCSSAFAAEKYALLIGVTKYEHARMNASPLKYPEDDAKAVADLLKQGGYTVRVLLGKDATKAAIEAALKTFSKEGNADGVVLIGMFGHGVQYDELAYFGPFDTSTRVVKDFKGNTLRDKNGQLLQEPDPDSMVSMRDILDAMTLSKAKNKIMLADCCRENTSAARGRNAFGSNLTTADLPEGTAALFACSRNEQAYEHDDWQHGAFTRAFLDQVVPIAAQGNVKAGNLAEKIQETVEAMVQEKARKSQNVTYLNSGIVDLQLRLPKSLTAKSDAPMRPTPEKPAPKSPSSSSGSDLITNSIGMKLKLIPAGEFLMGSPADEADRYDNEGPQHTVRITKPFYMGVTEVTQGEWYSVMKTKPWKGEENVKEGANYAATYVSWDDAVEYCQKLSALEGQTYRLPTEAEWEYACRGGKSTAYSFGSDASQLSNYAWWGGFSGDGNAETEQYAHEVGGKQSNPFGMHDMHGNVCEWCSDLYGPYIEGTVVDPKGPTTDLGRVYRGGCWVSSDSFCRSAYRKNLVPSYRNPYNGFRLALSP